MSQIKNTAVYVSFVASLKAKLLECGVPLVESQGTDTGLPENKGWVRFESAVNGHKLYVPKSELRMGLCETTLPIGNCNGAKPLPKVNGKIMTRFTPDADLIADTIVDLMTDPGERIPANKAPSAKGA